MPTTNSSQTSMKKTSVKAQKDASEVERDKKEVKQGEEEAKTKSNMNPNRQVETKEENLTQNGARKSTTETDSTERLHSEEDRNSGAKKDSKTTQASQNLRGATAAHARRLQASLKALVPWHKRGSEDGPTRAKTVAPDRGSSPPNFILDLTVTWAGGKGLASCTATDLGEKVALWTVGYPDAPASLVMYDPKKKMLEELLLKVEPDAVLGVTFTAGELSEGKAGALLFGGATQSGTLLNDCWFYTAVPGKWTKLKCTGEIPMERCNHAAAFSIKARSFYISGGEGRENKPLQGTHQLVGGEWKVLSVKEDAPARSRHTLSVVSKGSAEEYLLMFGGQTEAGDVNELWSLPITSKAKHWSEILGVAGQPPAPRHGHSAVTAGSRCFIFGGLGRHWLGWEIVYFEVYGFAVATGDPSTSFHIFATGKDMTSDGAVFKVGAVCSTLDVSVIHQGISDTNVVSGDNRERVTELSSSVEALNREVTEKSNFVNFLTTRTESVEATLRSIITRIDLINADVAKWLEAAQALEALAGEAMAEAAARESNSTKTLADVDKHIARLYELLGGTQDEIIPSREHDSLPSESSSDLEDGDLTKRGSEAAIFAMNNE